VHFEQEAIELMLVIPTCFDDLRAPLVALSLEAVEPFWHLTLVVLPEDHLNLPGGRLLPLALLDA